MTTNKFTVTLKSLRKAGACYEGYNRVVRSLQGLPFSEDDAERESYIRFRHTEEIPVLSILESNGLNDALWSLRALSTPQDAAVRLLACEFAREVEHLNTDPRVKACIDAAEGFAKGTVTEDQLGSAAAAADAARAARAAAAAAHAADAAYAAAAAAAAAAHADDAAYAAAAAAHAARAAAAAAAADAYAAAADAAYAAAAAREKQSELLKSMLTSV